MSSPLDPTVDLPTPDSTPTKSVTPPSETSSGFEMVESNKDKDKIGPSPASATPTAAPSYYVPAPAPVPTPSSPSSPGAPAVSISMPPLIPVASPQKESSTNENSFEENGFVFGYLKGT